MKKILLVLIIILIYSGVLRAQTDSTSVIPGDSIQPALNPIILVVPDTINDVQPEPIPAVDKDTVKHWKKSANYNLNFAQAGFKNWAGGGQNSIAISAITSMTLSRDDSVSSWVNQLDATYGITRIGEKKDFRKTDDVLIFKSKYGLKLKENWKISAMLDFRTQMRAGYRYEAVPNTDIEQQIFISEFLAPGFTLLSLGIEYSVKDFYSLRFAPLTGKTTIVLNEALSDSGAYGVDPGRKIRNEFGAQFNGSYKQVILKNVTLQGNLLLFSAYEQFGNIDVNFEGLLMLRVNKFITSSISGQLVYDDDTDVQRQDGTTGPALQAKHIINVGFIFQL